MSTPPPAAALASSAAAPAAAPTRHLRICFNSYCKDPKSEPSRKKGWRLRSGEQAELCDRCFCSYEQGTFCETFHSDAAGWRNCESCGKRVHCGCIVSAPAYMLLDGGGIECVACAKKGLITAPKQLWPSQLLLPVQVSERPKEFPVKARNQMAGSVPGQWRQASNMWNMGVQSELHQRLAFEFDRPSSIEKLLSAARSSLASQDKKIEDLPDRVTSGNLNHVTRDRYANGAAGLNSVSGFSAYSGGGKTESLHDSGFHGGENDPMFTRKGADPCSTSSGVNHETHPNSCAKSLSPPVLKEDSASPLIALATPCSLPSDTKDLDRISTDQPHRQAASPLGRPMYPNSSNVIDSCGELQAMRNGKPRGDLRARTQLLPRYWPRSTDQELQQISGDTNAVITPLFEKMLSASDAGRIGRLVLPKRCAETYFPSIGSPEGVPLKVQDIAGNEWTFQFRYWPNNNSRMYVLEGVTACIQSMQLQAGDTVIFSRMDPEGKLVMGHRKASSTSTEQDNQASKSGNGSATPPEANNKNISADIIPSLPHRPLKGCTESPNPIDTTDQGALSKSDKSGFIQKNGPVAKSSAPSKRKGSTPGSKSKRLRIDHEDSIQLKLTWEAAQDLLRPPPNGVPSVVFIEGHEFEEYEEAPVIGMPTFFTTSPTGDKCQWIQCGNCSKWRKIPADALLPSRWICSDNTWDPERSSCSAAQEQSMEQLADILPIKTAASKRSKIKLEFVEVSGGLDTLANLAILGEGEDLPPSSQPPTTKHPRHRPGCSCIVCIQPPSGKGPKHKQTCTCNVCLTVKRRFKTLMLRREKRQSEKEAEGTRKKQQLIQSPEMSGAGSEFSPNGKNIGSQITKKSKDGVVEEDAERRKSLPSPLKAQIDLNIQPEREEEPSPVANSGSMPRAFSSVTT